MKILVEKKKHPNPIVLKNGDAYDGLASVYDDNGKLLDTFHINTDATNTYNGGEVASGEYIYRKYVKPNGRIVYNIYTKQGNNILPSTRPNPNHGGKKIIQAVQIHCGGRDWDGSHGCLTIHPLEWQRFIQVVGEKGVVKIVENLDKKEKSAGIVKNLDKDEKEKEENNV